MDGYDVGVAGAGPAGLFAALAAAGEGRRVAVFEKNAVAGKKLLLSGAGQCNFTHTGESAEFLSHYGKNGRFLRFAYAGFDNRRFVEFLRSRGVEAVTDKNGKFFPARGRAAGIRDLLVNVCLAAGVVFHYGKDVTGVVPDGDGFAVNGEGFSCKVRCFVLATGGMSYPGTGSTGAGYTLAKELGHPVVPPSPALTPFFVKDFPYASCSGVSFKKRLVSVWRAGKKIASHKGDVLITHNGISGPGILDISRYAEKGDVCQVGFVSAETREELDKCFISGGGRKSVKGVLAAYTDLAAGFLDCILEVCKGLGKLDGQMNAADLTKGGRKYLLGLLGACPFVIEAPGGVHQAMATAGGVALGEVNPMTMGSRLVPGLFFAGEVLDVVGDTGGYNIQAAASTGMLAGRVHG